MRYAYLLLALLSVAGLRAQNVPNTCATAVPIVPPEAREDCFVGTSFELELAGTTFSGKTSDCIRAGGYVDQWFTWRATTDGLTWSPYNTNTYIAIFDACDTDTPLDCSNRRSPRQRLYGWAEGDELLIQIAARSDRERVVFCLQEYDTPPPPANDDCVGAQAITIGENECGEVVRASNVGATVSARLGIECTSPGVQFGRDRWYSFVPTTTKARIDVLAPNGNEIEIAGEVYLGGADGSCDELAVSQCVQPLRPSAWNHLTGLVPGRRHYLRIFSTTRDVEGTYSFCLVGAPPAPANDDCTGATVVTLGDRTPGPAVDGNSFAATASELVGGNCWGTEGDQWYEFVPAQPTVFLEVTGPGSTQASLNAKVLHGGCGAEAEVVTCVSGIQIRTRRISGLTPGETYLLQVSTYERSFQGAYQLSMYNDGPAPANDFCADAIPVDVGATGTCGPTVTAMGEFASDSGFRPSYGGCSSLRGLKNFKDLYYAFTPTYNNVDLVVSDLEVLGQIGYQRGPYVEVLSGTCDDLQLTRCPSALRDGRVTMYGLTPGETHYLRFFTSAEDIGIKQVSFCLEDGPVPPPNDSPDGALPVTLGSGTCGPQVTATFGSATYEADLFESCQSYREDVDVWYRFTPAGPRAFLTTTIVESGLGSVQFGVFAKAQDGVGEEIVCSGIIYVGSPITIEGLTADVEHYLRLYTADPVEAGVTFCLFDDFPAPANDECAAATDITLGTSDAPTNVSATFKGATGSADIEGQCRGVRSGGLTYYNADIFYRFTAEQPLARLRLTSNLANLGILVEVYRGGDCEALTPLYCSRNRSRGLNLSTSVLDLYDLVPGEAYTLRLYQQYVQTPADFAFNIWTGPAPPTNDDCAGAIALPVGTDGCLEPTVGDNTSASDSAPTGLECSTHANSYRYDVWYAFTPATDEVYVSFPESFSYDMAFEVYASDDCTDFALAQCDAQQNSSNDRYRLRDLTPGRRYLLRVYPPRSNFTFDSRYGEFEVCLQAPGTPPVNDLCASAKPLPIALGFNARTLDTSTTAFATGNDIHLDGCQGRYGGGEVYYRATVPRSGNFDIAVTTFRGTGVHYLAVYDGCPSDNAAPVACGYTNSVSRVLSVGDLTPGQEVTIAVYPDVGQGEGEFTITAFEQVPRIATGIRCNSLPFVFVNGGAPGEFVDVLTAGGAIVASIEDRYDLGQVDVSHYGNPDAGMRQTEIFPEDGYTTDRSVAIVPRLQPTGPIKLRLYFTRAELGELLGQMDETATLTDLIVARLPDGVCSAEPSGEPSFSRASFLAYDSGYRLEVTVPGFSEFFVVAPGNAPVPVTLARFDVTAVDCGRLRAAWSAEREDGFRAYAVETSPDGATWSAQADVYPDAARDYAAEVPAAGAVTYVRLRMDDLDGSVAYSDARAVRTPCARAALLLAPNPTSSGVGTRVEAPAGSPVRVLDALGRVLLDFPATATGTAATATYDIPAGALPAGTYVVVAGGQSGRLVVR